MTDPGTTRTRSEREVVLTWRPDAADDTAQACRACCLMRFVSSVTWL